MDLVITSDNIISPLGKTTAENISAIRQGKSGIKYHEDLSISQYGFFGSNLPKDYTYICDGGVQNFTKFENLIIESVSAALKNTKVDISDPRTLLIICSTKGNINLLENEPMSRELKNRISLSASAQKISDYLGYINKPVVVSNACISGLTGLLFAKRMLQSGKFDNAIVTGFDLITRFVFSGFDSFKALSNSRCKPFDKSRNGINLGEAAATLILTNKVSGVGNDIALSGGALSNDSNHISGPSRTGEELSWAIDKALEKASITGKSLGFISAHGTATVFNDQMEAKAFSLSGLLEVPVVGLKSYFGHTLGAAGLVESIVCIHSMKKNLIFPTLGYKEKGVPEKINVTDSIHETPISHCLKTGSGFGGCNAALVFSKLDSIQNC